MIEDVLPSCPALESLTIVSSGKAWHFQADILAAILKQNTVLEVLKRPLVNILLPL